MNQKSLKAEKNHSFLEGCRTFSRRKAAHALLLLLLLAFMFVLAFDSLQRESITLDEPLHLTAGYAFWSLGDFRLQGSHGALTQRWYAIPLLFADTRFPPPDDPSWRPPGYLGMNVCQKFFFNSGNDPDAMVFAGRLMAVVISMATAFACYFWSRKVFGRLPALLTCFLCVTSPTILANGRLMTSDVPAALFFLMSLGTIWSLLRQLTWLRLFSSVICFGCVLVSKMSGGLVFPMALIMLLLRIGLRRPWIVRLSGMKPYSIVTFQGKLALALAVMVLHAVGAFIIIWGAYGWQYKPSADWNPTRDSYIDPREVVFEGLGASRTYLEGLEKWKILPEAYIYGLAHTLRYSAERPAFLNGNYSLSGWWYYFPYAFLVKTPLPMLGLLALSFIIVASSIVRRKSRRWTILWLWLDRTSLVWIPIGCYSLVALFTNLNIGHRHLLPLYPPLFIVAGAAVRKIFDQGKIVRTLTCLLVLANIPVVARIHPHYLAYFNVLAGGPSHGYSHLTDSNVDWGQSLPSLSKWLQENKDPETDEVVYFRYFGFDSPQRWGIQATAFPDVSNPRFSSDYPVAFRPGLYCFSATDFILPGMGKPPWDDDRENEYQQVLQAFREFEQQRKKQQQTTVDNDLIQRQWNDFAVNIAIQQWHRLRSYLFYRKPIAMPGYSILIFRLSENDLQQALLPTLDSHR